jgi:hypothetical protein
VSHLQDVPGVRDIPGHGQQDSDPECDDDRINGRPVTQPSRFVHPQEGGKDQGRTQPRLQSYGRDQPYGVPSTHGDQDATALWTKRDRIWAFPFLSKAAR